MHACSEADMGGATQDENCAPLTTEAPESDVLNFDECSISQFTYPL
jgi:hypothetical protein